MDLLSVLQGTDLLPNQLELQQQIRIIIIISHKPSRLLSPEIPTMRHDLLQIQTAVTAEAVSFTFRQMRLPRGEYWSRLF